MKPGAYPGFALAGKALSVVADGGAVQVQGGVRVEDILDEQHVLLAGLTATRSKSGAQEVPALALEQTFGSVRVEDCQLFGADVVASGCSAGCPGGEARGGAAVSAVAADDAVFVRCTVRGGSGEDDLSGADTGGGDGVAAVGARLSFHHCDVRGGDGGGATFPAASAHGGDGGAGIRLADATGRHAYVHAAGTSVRGGDGGDGGQCQDAAGAGGDGLVLVGGNGPGCDALELDSALQAGIPGCGSVSSGPGQPLVLAGGATLTQLPGTARAARMASPVREQQPIALTFEGEPGDLVLVVRSQMPQYTPLPTRRGMLHLERGTFKVGVVMGVVPPSGVLQLDLPAPLLLPGDEAERIFLQVLFRDALQHVWPGPAATPVFLDGSL